MRLDELGRRVRELCLAEDPSPALAEGCLGVANPERARVYRRLVRSVLVGTLENCFPVLRGVLGEEDWGRLAAEFLARRPPATPIVREVPADFVRFLEETPHPLEARHPYLRELAAYEQAELAVMYAPEAAPAPIPRLPETGAEGAWLPVLNPALHARAYAWPVHRLGAGAAEAGGAETGPHCLAIVRHPETARTAPVALAPESFVLLDHLRTGGRSYAEAVAATARYFDVEDAAALAREVRPLLEDFLARGLLLGSRL